MSLSDLDTKLATYKEQLASLEQVLAADPNNEEFVKLKNDLTEAITLTSDLVKLQNSQSSLPSGEDDAEPEGPQSDEPKWAIGRMCQARYSVDGKWYYAIVEGFDASTRKYDVVFSGFGNRETVEEKDTRPVQPKIPDPSKVQPGVECRVLYSQDGNWYNARIDACTPSTGTYSVTYTDYGNEDEVELAQIMLGVAKKETKATGKRTAADLLQVKIEEVKALPAYTDEEREAKRKKLHAIKNQARFQKLEDERNEKKSNWQSFVSKEKKLKKKGFVSKSLTKRQSIFKSPDSVDGKVGVTGSGKGITDFTDTRVKHRFEDDGE